MEKRMYFFVPYNISPIQQAIQAGHAALEYAYHYGASEEYVDFIENWKTWIILNGGTTNNSSEYVGSMNEIETELIKENIVFSTFHEPDLNDALTSICVIASERVFNWEDYPDYITWVKESGNNIKLINGIDDAWDNTDLINKYINHFDLTYEEFVLKKIIYGKKLA